MYLAISKYITWYAIVGIKLHAWEIGSGFLELVWVAHICSKVSCGGQFWGKK